MSHRNHLKWALQVWCSLSVIDFWCLNDSAENCLLNSHFHLFGKRCFCQQRNEPFLILLRHQIPLTYIRSALQQRQWPSRWAESHGMWASPSLAASTLVNRTQKTEQEGQFVSLFFVLLDLVFFSRAWRWNENVRNKVPERPRCGVLATCWLHSLRLMLNMLTVLRDQYLCQLQTLAEGSIGSGIQTLLLCTPQLRLIIKHFSSCNMWAAHANKS